jgi:hypothetical protein
MNLAKICISCFALQMWRRVVVGFVVTDDTGRIEVHPRPAAIPPHLERAPAHPMSPSMHTLPRSMSRLMVALAFSFLLAGLLGGCQDAPGADGRYASGTPGAGSGRWAP